MPAHYYNKFTERRLRTLGNSASKVQSNATQQLTAVEKSVTMPDDTNHQSSPLLDTGIHELAGTNLELISTDETPDTMIVDQTRSPSSSVLESEIPTQSDYEEEDSSAYFMHALLHAIMLIFNFVFLQTPHLIWTLLNLLTVILTLLPMKV